MIFLLERLVFMIPLVLSLAVHEWAHAFAAYKLGDDTAKAMGRMTLDPLAHIDWVGTVALPLIGVPFGWAKPVPINPVRFDSRFSMTTGMLISAAAGPVSNMVLAALAIAIRVALADVLPAHMLDLLDWTWMLNISLGVFNLLPVSPLDGSRIVDGLIPRKWSGKWDEFSRYGPYILVGILALPMVIGLSLFAPFVDLMQLFP